MVKSGLIAGAVAFVLVLAAGLISPVCAPCPGIFVGLLAGYLAGVFDKPLDGGAGAKSGAIAGGIAGGLGLLGNLVAGLINVFIQPAAMANFYQQLNITPPDQSTVWGVQLGLACCVGLINLALMAGLGAAGAALWVQFNKKNPSDLNLPVPPAV